MNTHKVSSPFDSTYNKDLIFEINLLCRFLILTIFFLQVKELTVTKRNRLRIFLRGMQFVSLPRHSFKGMNYVTFM
jgi:hypothetical protein